MIFAPDRFQSNQRKPLACLASSAGDPPGCENLRVPAETLPVPGPCRSGGAALLEKQVPAELGLARGTHGAGDSAERGILRRAAGCIWVVVVRRIGNIEGIRLEVAFHTFVDRPTFRERHPNWCGQGRALCRCRSPRSDTLPERRSRKYQTIVEVIVRDAEGERLPRLRVGQSVIVKVDALGTDFQGTVEAMPAATGDRASLFPAEDATGNYVKVVQRLPVRIHLNAGQQDLDRLRPGMSTETKVRFD